MRSSSVLPRRDEQGYVAVVAALLISVVLLGIAAIGVDTARWYVERERAQKAADAAALAGVVYLPDNLSQAILTARASAKLNGFDHAEPGVEVQVEYGERRSQLRVTIVSTIPNQFGTAIGVDTATIDRTAVADYTSPAPMGSPCNAFGNEPPGGNNKTTGRGASGPQGSQIPSKYTTGANPICTSTPNFWAAVEGPMTDKQQGDRYSTGPCTLKARTASDPADGPFTGPLPHGCASNRNTEALFPEGYFFSIKVPQTAVGTPITVQLYDPAFFKTGASCSTDMPATTNNTSQTLNDFVTDALYRYTAPYRFSNAADAARARTYCPGDNLPQPRATTAPPTTSYPVTSFAIRAANDGQDPMAGTPYPGCTAQFPGFASPPTLGQLTKDSANYRDYMARLFHQWVPLCTFTPMKSGDHYLQVRTNVALGGNQQWDTSASPAEPTRIYRDNPQVLERAGNTASGEGSNGFAIRALSSRADQISVSGWARMPMFQNVPTSTATFNLLRVLPAAAGQSVAFEFYDAADARDNSDNPVSGKVQVIPPLTASGSQPAPYGGCQGALNDKPYETLTDCAVTINGTTHNGQVQHMSIPIPSTYSCKETELTGCWFKVKIDLSNASSITDFTTWNASLQGDPIRLIE